MSAPARAIRRVAGRALPLRGHDIDTDRIMPARFLKSTTFDHLEQHLFEDERHAEHPFSNPRYGGARVLIVNRNFGCGSSREHAPQALQRWGIGAVVGESFSEIFLGNAVGIGMPCVAVNSESIERLLSLVERAPEILVTVDLEAMSVSAPDLAAPAALAPSQREALLTGAWDSTGLLLDRYEEVAATAERLPYLRGF